jgi:hypothetical protein
MNKNMNMHGRCRDCKFFQNWHMVDHMADEENASTSYPSAILVGECRRHSPSVLQSHPSLYVFPTVPDYLICGEYEMLQCVT